MIYVYYYSNEVHKNNFLYENKEFVDSIVWVKRSGDSELVALPANL